ncbi:MAG: helix-turn-helix domain-containing protein, partial [Syntrophales bacterium]
MGELKVNLTELQELIRSGENEKLEFKKSTGQRTDAARTVCAMLNGLGGFVFFGKTDKFLPNYSQCLLKMARFRGTDKSEFIDNRQ